MDLTERRVWPASDLYQVSIRLLQLLLFERVTPSLSLSVKLVSRVNKCENNVTCCDAKLSPQPLCDHTAAVISLAAAVNVSAFKKEESTSFRISLGSQGF